MVKGPAREGQYLIPVLYYYFILRILPFTRSPKTVLSGIISISPPTHLPNVTQPTTVEEHKLRDKLTQGQADTGSSRWERDEYVSCEAVSSSGGAGRQGRAQDGTGGERCAARALAAARCECRACVRGPGPRNRRSVPHAPDRNRRVGAVRVSAGSSSR